MNDISLVITSLSGGLPSGWTYATIGELVASDGVFLDGDWVESKDQDPQGEIRLIQLADVGDGYYRDRSNRFLTYEKAVELNCTFLERGDVLVARMPDPLGRACIFPGDQQKAVTVVDVCIVRCGSSGVSHRWLMHMLDSPESRSVIASLQSGTTRKRISRKNLARIKFPIPPLAEQCRIAEKIEELFSDLDAGVAALRQVQQQLKRYRQAVLKAAVEGKLTEAWRTQHGHEAEPAGVLLECILAERRRTWEAEQLAKYEAKGKTPPENWQQRYKEPAAPDTADLPDLPDGWVWATWNQVGFSQNGRAFPSKEYQPHGVKLIRPGNLHVSGSVEWNEKNTRYMPETWAKKYPHYLLGGNELVMNLTAQSLKDEFLGRICLTGPDDVCLLNQRIARLRPILFSIRYLLWMFKSKVFRSFVNSLNTGSLIQHMFTSQLAEFRLPLPPLAEQDVIVQEIEQLLSAADHVEGTIERELQRAERLRQSILKRAFEGKLVPQDPSDEPASVLLERIREEKKRPKAQTSVSKKHSTPPKASTQLTLDL